MQFELVDISDPRVAIFANLRDSQLRRQVEHDEGLFIAEGEKIIRRAARAGYVPHSLLLEKRWLSGLAEIEQSWPAVPIYVGSQHQIEQLSGFHVHRGALAAFRRPSPRTWEEFLNARRLMVCQGLVDHANLGAIMRLAAGLGWDGVVISHDSADPLYRRAIKTSMGASLVVPWIRMSRDGEGLNQLRDAGFQLVATSPIGQATPASKFAPAAKLALLIGNEGAGLSDDWLDQSDATVRIEMSPGIDSLNVATAVAILGYLYRQ